MAQSVSWSSAALRRLGKDVILVRPRYGDASPNRYEVPLRSFRFPGRDYYVSWFSWIRSPTAWSSRFGIDPGEVEVVHVHSLGPIGMLGLRYAWSESIPVVLTWHTDLVSYAKAYPEVYFGAAAILSDLFMYSPARKKITWSWSIAGTIRNLLRSVDCTVAPSRKTAIELLSLCPEAAISVVPTGLPERLFVRGSSSWRSIRRRYGLADDDKLVLFVGRLSVEKNPGLLISVLRVLHSLCPEVKGVAVGDPSPGRKGRRWRSALQRNGGVFIPSMAHADLMNLYDAVDLLLVTSSTETQGLTILEACASGLPVVCIDPALAFFGDAAMPDVWVAESAAAEDVGRIIAHILQTRPRPKWSRPRPLAHKYSALSANAQALRLIDLYDNVSSRTHLALSADQASLMGPSKAK